MYFQVCSNPSYPQHSGERYRTNGLLVNIIQLKFLLLQTFDGRSNLGTCIKVSKFFSNWTCSTSKLLILILRVKAQEII